MAVDIKQKGGVASYTIINNNSQNQLKIILVWFQELNFLELDH